MKVSALREILRNLGGDCEIYALNSTRDVIDIRCVEVEYPADDEGEICVNIAINTGE